MANSKRLLASLLVGALCVAMDASAWGPTGHRISGKIAEAYLSDKSREMLVTILGTQTLARASTWADEMRSNPDSFWQKKAPSLHYVTVPPGKNYAEVGAPAKGDAVSALAQFKSTLQDPDSSLPQKQLALRFTIHIIADLHQPLHVGNGEDRGGTRVPWFYTRPIRRFISIW